MYRVANHYGLAYFSWTLGKTMDLQLSQKILSFFSLWAQIASVSNFEQQNTTLSIVMGGTFQVTAWFQDSDIFQKAMKMALRCIWSMNFTSFRIQTLTRSSQKRGGCKARCWYCTGTNHWTSFNAHDLLSQSDFVSLSAIWMLEGEHSGKT